MGVKEKEVRVKAFVVTRDIMSTKSPELNRPNGSSSRGDDTPRYRIKECARCVCDWTAEGGREVLWDCIMLISLAHTLARPLSRWVHNILPRHLIASLGMDTSGEGADSAQFCNAEHSCLCAGQS